MELEAAATGVKILDESEPQFPLTQTIDGFLKDIKTFRKKLTWQKYNHVLNLFAEYAPKSDARDITAEDVKGFLAWRKSKGFDPGTTLYTDRVILHNFFNRLKIDNPVKEVPKLAKFRKRPVAYTDADLKKFFGACTDWDRAFFSLLLATGLRRGEMQTLEWSDLDLARRRVHVTAKPQYAFTPKDWEERRFPLPLKSSKSCGSTLVSLNRAFDVPTIDDLLFLRHVPPGTLAISGDGVLKFSRLISAGLAEFRLKLQNGPLVLYEVFLTAKGMQLVDAWESGDREKVRNAISPPNP